MKELSVAFFTSYLITLLLLRYEYLHGHFTNDHDRSGPQKNHKLPVPRIGGVSIISGLFMGMMVLIINKINLAPIFVMILFCALPTYVLGTIEDITKSVGITARLSATAVSAALFIHLGAAEITHLDIPFLDSLFIIPFFGMAMTIFAVTGLTNAYNIIDGFNGLASMVGIITLLALTFVAFQLNDSQLLALGIIMVGSILGFFIWNYPRGLIFLGDGG